MARSAWAIPVLVMTACAGPDGVPLPAEIALHGKCAFIGRSDTRLVPGDVFVYVGLAAGNEYSVLTGRATDTDPLLDRTAVQRGALVPARVVGVARLEFGGLSEARDEPADHFLSIGGAPGELHVSIGTTDDTDLAYPRCVFWELE
jgi:hypothetical protein